MLFLSKGDGTFSYTSYDQIYGWFPSEYSNPQFQFGDVNGDGKADLIWTWNAGNQIGRVTWPTAVNGTGLGSASYDLESGWSPTGYSNPRYFTSDVIGDGKADLTWAFTYGGALFQVLFKGPDIFPDLLAGVTNGLGAVTSITHKPLTDSTVYTKYSDYPAFPVIDLQVPLYVVSSTSTSDGIGGSNVSSYKYYGLKAHLQGGGLLGFALVEATDALGIKTTRSFRQDYPFQGLPLLAIKKQPSDAMFNRVENTWTLSLTPNDTGKYHRCDLTTIVEQSWDLKGNALPTVTTVSTYDAYGNPGAVPGAVTVTTSDGFIKSTVNNYAPPDTANWLLGLLRRSQVTSTTPTP